MGKVWTEAEKRAEIRELVKKYKLNQEIYLCLGTERRHGRQL